MNTVLLAILGYIAAQLALGMWVSRRIETEEDYLLAGRSLGPLLSTFSIFATWFGAETCMGAAGKAYRDGLTLASAEPFAYGLCLVLMGVVFALPLWRRKLTTLADLFRERYSPRVERWAALVMIPSSVLWAAAQIRGFAQVFAGAADIPVAAGLSIGAGVVILYTMSGGLRADVVTDLVQGLCLIAGLVALALGVVWQAGGAAEVIEKLPLDRISLVPDAPLFDVLEAWAIPLCGSVVAQELVARVLASRSPGIARRSALIGGGMYVAVGLIPVFLGLLGSRLLPGLSDPEQVLPALAQRQLPALFHVLFAGALVSAILSTVDSTLLVAASLFSHNVLAAHFPTESERVKVRRARAAVVGFGLLAWSLALSAEGVFALVEQASAFGSAGVLVIVVFGLFSRRGGEASALLALFGGLAAYLAGTALGFAWPYLLSLAVALLGFGAGLRSGR